MPNNCPAEILLGLPKEYAFLVFGLIGGFVLGLLVLGFVASRMVKKHMANGQLGGKPGAASAISLVVNGRNIEIPAEIMTKIQSLLKSKQKPEAIKLLRGCTGLAVAEARGVMDSFEKRLP